MARAYNLTSFPPLPYRFSKHPRNPSPAPNSALASARRGSLDLELDDLRLSGVLGDGGSGVVLCGMLGTVPVRQEGGKGGRGRERGRGEGAREGGREGGRRRRLGGRKLLFHMVATPKQTPPSITALPKQTTPLPFHRWPSRSSRCPRWTSCCCSRRGGRRGRRQQPPRQEPEQRRREEGQGRAQPPATAPRWRRLRQPPPPPPRPSRRRLAAARRRRLTAARPPAPSCTRRSGTCCATPWSWR